MSEEWDSTWTFTFGTKEGPEPRSAVDSFTAMEEAAQSGPYRQTSSAGSSCPHPWLEVLVRDASGQPVAGVPCKLAFPEGGDQEKTTGSDGKARFEDLGADVTKLTTRMIEEDPEADPPKVRVEVVPVGTTQGKPATTEEDSLTEVVLGYVDLGWHDL